MTTRKQYAGETIYQGMHVTVTKQVRILGRWFTYYRKVL